MIVCSKCRIKKNEEEFYKDKCHNTGRSSACKACMVSSRPKNGPVMVGTKVCSKCKIKKLVEDFHCHPAGRDGRYPSCKECRRQPQPKEIDGKRACSKCRIVKLVEEFPFDQKTKTGRAYDCNDCRFPPEEAMKKCTKCAVVKPIDDFSKNASKRIRDSICKDCASLSSMGYYKVNFRKVNNNRLVRMFGITADEYDKLEAKQGGVCAICKKPCRSGNRLSVDHNHNNGKVRELLCSPCNTALGLVLEDRAILVSMDEYIVKHAERGRLIDFKQIEAINPRVEFSSKLSDASG